MPVTAKLSQAFYERLGNDIANELVEWFNSVDATYRSDLRELNELNFARFDAKVEQRMVQLEARLEQRIVQVESRFDGRLVELESRVNQRFMQVELKIDNLEARLLGRLEARIAQVQTDLQRRMLAGWSSIVLMLLAMLLTNLWAR